MSTRREVIAVVVSVFVPGPHLVPVLARAVLDLVGVGDVCSLSDINAHFPSSFLLGSQWTLLSGCLLPEHFIEVLSAGGFFGAFLLH